MSGLALWVIVVIHCAGQSFDGISAACMASVEKYAFVTKKACEKRLKDPEIYVQPVKGACVQAMVTK
jgi:hypothetical protein